VVRRRLATYRCAMAWWAPLPRPDPDEIQHSTILSWLGPMAEDREVRQTAEERHTYDLPLLGAVAHLLPRWTTRRRADASTRRI